jgi:hypothetical protein
MFKPEAHLATVLNATKWLFKIPSVRAVMAAQQLLGTCMTRPPSGCSCGPAIAINSACANHRIAQKLIKLTSQHLNTI